MAADILRYLYRHIKIAAKNVMANKAGYACFFAALFIIQTFFATMTLIMFSNDKSERARVEDEYDYHVALYGLNEDQMLMIENGSLIYYSADDVYEIVRTDKRYNAYTETYVYDYYFLLKGSDSAALRASYNRFHDNHFRQLVRLTREGDDPIVFEYTPLYNFGANLAVNHFIYAVSIAALAALSIFLLVVLYNIRINHYKFIYGIYMSFGADFKKLFETAFFEMLVVWALMLLPATAVSILCSYLIFAIRGIKFYFPAAMLLLTVVYGLFVLLVSVYFPMRIVSLRAPMSLIAAEDNSNLVSSPRRSFNIFGTKFPLLYEIFSTWRFRMYNLRLLVSAVIFTSLFISGLYIAEITRDTLAEEKPQFELDMSGAGVVFDDVMRDELYSIPGVSLVSKSNSAEAVYLDQHIRVPSELTRPFSNLVVPENMDGYRVTSDVVYRTIDDDIAAQLEKYDYDGDLYSPLHEPDTVVVSDSIGNTRKFNFKVGDTIEIATVRIRHAAVDPNMTGMALLREQLEYEIAVEKHESETVKQKELLDVQLMQNDLDKLYADKEAAKLYSEVAGTVSFVKTCSPGDWVNAGETIATVIDITDLYIKIDPNNDVDQFMIGRPITIRYEGEYYDGTIVRNKSGVQWDEAAQGALVGSDGEEILGEESEDIIVKFNDIIPESSAVGNIADTILVLDKRENVIVISANLVKKVNGVNCVYVFKDNERVPVNVSLGLQSGSLVEITSGLEPGDEVIIR